VQATTSIERETVAQCQRKYEQSEAEAEAEAKSKKQKAKSKKQKAKQMLEPHEERGSTEDKEQMGN